jgi:antitoxin PrlF
MRTIDATVTSQGQVTIPAEVRRKLGLTKREKVTFVIEEDRVELIPARFTLESVFGSVEPLPNQSADFDREIEEAMEDHADEVVRKSRRQ